MADTTASDTFQRTVVSSAKAGGPLATKLHLPRTPPGFVPRPRLVDGLDEAFARDLTLVCAPAGFGKTSLLADWCHRRERPVGWLSLDGGDNDPVRFWRHVVAALDGVRPGLAERVGPLLGPPAPKSFDGLVSVLVNELAADSANEVLLVLDDYHLIETTQVHESLLFLLERAPSGLRVVLASRADPPLSLARMRARGQLAELRAVDLRFTAEEAAAMLQGTVGSKFPDDAAAALAARTEGWAAGLQLAGLSLRGRHDVDDFVARFSGSHRYVLDYLTEEVLERQPEPVREFLLETSVLERLSGPLCDAVTGRADGQTMLEAIERANLFLVSLDEVRGWWRYHHLFADLLRARLQQQRPKRALELHRNAAAWHDQQGLAEDAIRHAWSAADPTLAARLIERHFDGFLLRSEGVTVQRWLAALPAELVGSRPRLLLAQAVQALLGGRVDGVEVLLESAERAYADAADEPYEPSVGRAASLLTNVPAATALDRAFLAELRGDAVGTTEFAARTLAELGEGEWMLESLARGHLAMADWLRGKIRDAERALASLVDEWLAAGELYLAVRCCHQLAQVQGAHGRLDAALGTYQRVLTITAQPDNTPLPAAGVAYVGMAEVTYQRGQLDAALRHVTEGIALCRQLAYNQELATGLATLAWIRQAEGDPAGALDAIGEAERVAPGPGLTALLNPVPAQRARLLVAHGDVAAAVQWTEERGLSADDEPSYPQELEYLALARVLLAQDQPDQALALLQRLHADAAAQDRVSSLIEIQVLRALVLAASSDEPGAMAALAEALTLAHPQRYIRVFVDEGAPMATLLGRLIATQRTKHAATSDIPVRYLGQLAQALEHDATDGSPDAETSPRHMVTQLSDREREVLRLLAAGKQNQQIAGELYLALDTVKKHVGHILDKLGAANRTEATTRARDLGLLD